MKAIACLAAMLSVLTAIGQDRFPHIPENNAIYRVKAKLRSRHWLRPIPNETVLQTSGPPPKRTIFAEEAIETIAFLANALKSSSAFPDADDREMLRNFILPGMRHWVAEFRIEIEQKGVRSEALVKQINACASALQPQAVTAPFSDVPKEHWAAGDIQELKDFGLLDGYPNARFGGNR